LKYLAKPTNLPPSAEYLAASDDSTIHISAVEDWKDSAIQLKVLESRARKATIKLGILIQQGTPWKDLNMDCVSVSRAHIEVFLLRTFLTTKTSTSKLSVPLTKLLTLVPPHLLNPY
jgi:hypothetical protein